jgi:hypothetical protein
MNTLKPMKRTDKDSTDKCVKLFIINTGGDDLADGSNIIFNFQRYSIIQHHFITSYSLPLDFVYLETNLHNATASSEHTSSISCSLILRSDRSPIRLYHSFSSGCSPILKVVKAYLSLLISRKIIA